MRWNANIVSDKASFKPTRIHTSFNTSVTNLNHAIRFNRIKNVRKFPPERTPASMPSITQSVPFPSSSIILKSACWLVGIHSFTGNSYWKCLRSAHINRIDKSVRTTGIAAAIPNLKSYPSWNALVAIVAKSCLSFPTLKLPNLQNWNNS